jgi:tetratricopeptide (TPR) repeat protein
MHSQRLLALLVAAASFVPVTRAQTSSSSTKTDRAAAYYHYALGHLYAELSAAYGNRSEYVENAIENLRAALKADPKATFIVEELAELYISSGQIRSAVVEAEAAVKANPNDTSARRLLGRIYSRMLGDSQNGRINPQMVQKAIEQYEKIVSQEPKDLESWLMLGRLHKVAQDSPASEKAYRKVLEIDPENEDANVGLAMVYADLGDNKTASELLEKASGRSPSLRTLTTLASNYEQMRDFQMAASTLKRALALSPGNPDLRRAYAQNLLFSDQYDEALAVYEELAADEPKDAQSWLRISQIYRQKRDFDRARQASAKALEIEPNNLEYRYNEVTLLEAEGNLQQAIEEMKTILDATSRRVGSQPERANRVMLLERLGLLYRQNDQPAEAVAAFREMATADPDTGPRSAAQVIETYRGAKDYTAAVAEAEAAKTQFPQDRMVKMVRANLLAETGRVDEAAAEVRSLLDGKADREVYMSLAQIYEKAKNFPEMGKAIDKAEELSESPEQKEALWFMRGAMYERMKKFDASEAEFRKVLEANPENASALNYLGYMLADRNVQLTEAYEMIRKAVEMDPTNGAYLDSLGWVLYRLDRADEAEEALLRAITFAPRDPTVHDHLGDVYQKQGRWKDAVSQWERSLAEWKNSAAPDQDANEMAKVQKKIEGGKVRLAQESSRPDPKP